MAEPVQIMVGGKPTWVPTARCFECEAGKSGEKAAAVARDPMEPGPKPERVPCENAGEGCGGYLEHELIEGARHRFWARVGAWCTACLERKEERAADELYRDRVAASGLPKRYHGFRFDRRVLQGPDEDVETLAARVAEMKEPHLAITQYNAPVATALSRWKPGSPSVYLTGPVGGGKTTLVAALLHGLMRSGVEVCYLPEAALYEAERAKMKAPKGAGGFDLAAFAAKARVLAIDDLGTVEDLAPWQRNVFERMIAVRYDADLPVLVTSNFRLAEVARVHSERAASRLAEMCRREYELIGFDWRTGHRHARKTAQEALPGMTAVVRPRDGRAAAAGERDED